MAKRFSATRSTSLAVRFYDNVSTTGKLVQQTIETMTSEQKAYSVIDNAHTSNSKTVTVNTGSAIATFVSTSLATVPTGFPTQSINDFTIFINGVAVEKEAVTSVAQSGPNVVITFNATQLGYTISASDEYMITGKLEA